MAKLFKLKSDKEKMNTKTKKIAKEKKKENKNSLMKSFLFSQDFCLCENYTIALSLVHNKSEKNFNFFISPKFPHWILFINAFNNKSCYPFFFSSYLKWFEIFSKWLRFFGQWIPSLCMFFPYNKIFLWYYDLNMNIDNELVW